VKAIRSFLRTFSYVFHAAFAAIALVMAGVLLASGEQTVNFDLLPLTGRALVQGLLALALIGLLTLLLAIRHKAQALYVVWSVVVLALVVRFYFFSSYGYTPGTGGFTTALCALAAALLALIGARQKPPLNSR